MEDLDWRTLSIDLNGDRTSCMYHSITRTTSRCLDNVTCDVASLFQVKGTFLLTASRTTPV